MDIWCRIRQVFKRDLSLKVNQHDKKIGLCLKKNGLKIIPRQEKEIIITDFFNRKFLLKATQIKLYSLFSLEAPKNQKWMIFIPIQQTLNMFKTMRVHVVLVAWHMLCMIPYNMLQNSKLYQDWNLLYSLNRLV